MATTQRFDDDGFLLPRYGEDGEEYANFTPGTPEYPDDEPIPYTLTEEGEAALREEDEQESTVDLTQKGKWALAVDLLERAAQLLGIPTSEGDLRAYVDAKRAHAEVESSFQAQRIGREEAERRYREQFNDYSRGW
jgi:hypothetical protein